MFFRSVKRSAAAENAMPSPLRSRHLTPAAARRSTPPRSAPGTACLLNSRCPRPLEHANQPRQPSLLLRQSANIDYKFFLKFYKLSSTFSKLPSFHYVRSPPYIAAPASSTPPSTHSHFHFHTKWKKGFHSHSSFECPISAVGIRADVGFTPEHVLHGLKLANKSELASTS
ncbi:hypothetical protein AAHA92_17253 [Salvia divinorum]|uniref:Uncharacterized protein n=1 Tax=Salvia divinorum TaxID=28513 RepID=A0ABD1H1C4_SALDI